MTPYMELPGAVGAYDADYRDDLDHVFYRYRQDLDQERNNTDRN